MSAYDPDRPPALKRWGQNFLADPNYIRKIVTAIDPQPADRFLEIGPGHGELTFPLAERCATVTAIDIDPLLVAGLHTQAPANVTIVEGDVLAADLESLLPPGGRVYGSLPYYIASKIIFRLLDYRSRWPDGYFIVQREVATRMIAAPGGKEYGRLTVMLQAFCQVERIFILPPTVFRPEPKVESALVRLTPQAPIPGIADERLFANVVRAAFGQRRKKLSNALKALGAGELADELGLGGLRAEKVAVGDYITLANRLAGTNAP